MQNTTKTTKIPRVAFHLDSSNVSSNNGGSHVYLRVRIEGKYIYFPTNVYVAPEHWDKQAKKVRHVKGHRNSNLKEEQLDTLIANMRSAIGDIARAGRPITERSLKNRWGLESRETFRDFAEHILQTRKKHLGKSTLDNYKISLDKVDAFDPGVRLGSISPEWVQEFTEWLRSEGTTEGKPLKHNSMVLYLLQIRTLMKIAKKSGLIQHDPFEDLDERPKMKKSKREFLTEAEIQHLHNMYVRGDLLRKESYQSVHPHVLRPEVYHNLLQAFLVSVYTGLRKSDVRRVDEYLVGDHIYMTMKKTGMSIRIKIIDRLREIMHSENQILNNSFTVNQDVSRTLKIVLQIAGINRPLCFHSARHTFATTLLAKGVDLKTVSKLLGHKKIATTDIYTHITDKQREEGISRLDTLGESSEENPAEKIKALLAQHPELRQNEELQALFQRKGASIIHRVS